jgi:uncharacterized protein YqjF (DUF2071 family)
MASDFNRAILTDVAHRPWPMPAQPWVMTQTWTNLLFAHWPVDTAAIRAKVPSEFELDLFDGQAWLAVVPFYMSNVGPRALPALPFASEFEELNVRTYVRVGDRPGVYFFSLDAASAFAVKTARTLLNLPYFGATMKMVFRGDEVEYDSSRGEEPAAAFTARYRPIGAPVAPTPGTLEYFLTERYCLYHVDGRGRPYRLEIHHPVWPLQVAEATIERNSMASAAGFELPDRPPLLHFSKRQDVVAWAPTNLT